FGGDVYSEHMSALGCQVPCDPAFAAGKVTDALTRDIPHESFHCRKEWIIAQRTSAQPVHIPLGDLVVTAHRHRCFRHRSRSTPYQRKVESATLSHRLHHDRKHSRVQRNVGAGLRFTTTRRPGSAASFAGACITGACDDPASPTS